MDAQQVDQVDIKDSLSAILKENTDNQKSTKAATGRPEIMDSQTLAKGIDDDMDRTIHFNNEDSKSNLNSEQYKTLRQ